MHAIHGGAFFESIGVTLDDLSRRTTVINADVLDAWYDPSPRIVDAIQAHLPWLIKTSPPTHSEGLRTVISQTRNIPEANIALGPGSTSLTHLALPYLIPAGEKAVVLDPMYGEYEHLLNHDLGAQVVRCEQKAWDHFRPDVDHIIESARDTRLLCIVNPNSPTGRHIPRFAMLQLIEALPKTTTVWVDETYIDFVGQDQSLESEVPGRSNLVVCKSMSKFYALSGVRVGYLAAPDWLVSKVSEECPPWNIGLIAQLAAIEALRDAEYYSEKRIETTALRLDLVTRLEAYPELFDLCPSAANFVFVRLKRGTSGELTAKLAEQGIHLRDCDSLSPRFNGEYIRIAVKPLDQNARVVNALAQ